MKLLPKSKYGWLFVLFAILLFAMFFSILFGKREGFTKINMGKKLVYFYSTDCPYCEELTPAWDAVSAKGYSDKMIKFDANADKTIAEERNITSYPTILLLDKGVTVEKYNGGRSEEDIEIYVKNNL